MWLLKFKLAIRWLEMIAVIQHYKDGGNQECEE